MDLSRLPTGTQARALLRRSIQQLLIGGAVRALLLSGLRLAPPPPAPQPPVDVATALEPFARLLWRRRATLLLARACPPALASAVVLNLLRLVLFSTLPRLACWSVAAVLLLLGLWVALCQRPTLGETARLLDRRFGLRESLGTAAEPGLGAVGSLAERQHRQALASLDRLPAHPWGGSWGGWGRTLLPVLIVAAAGGTLAGAARQDVGSSAATATSARPLGLAQVPVQAPGAAPRQAGAPAPAGLHPRQGATESPRSDLFIASFQVHAAPAGASLPAGSMAQGAPGQVALDGSGGSGGQAGGASDALSGSGRDPSGRQGGSGTAAGSAGKPGPGKGEASGPGGQSPRNQAQGAGQGSGGTQGATAAPPQGAQDGQGGAAPSPGAGGQPPSGANGQGSAQGANPFGQDARPANPQGRGGGQGNSGKGSAGGASPPAAPRSGATAPKAGRAGVAGRPTGRMAPGGPDGMDPTRRGRGASPSGTARASAAAAGQAPAAQGRELDLGGHAIAGLQAQGGHMVRVLPRSSVPLPGAAGSTQSGPTTVQGYVPEDNSDLSPEEQALLRAYFANGGGS